MYSLADTIRLGFVWDLFVFFVCVCLKSIRVGIDLRLAKKTKEFDWSPANKTPKIGWSPANKTPEK